MEADRIRSERAVALVDGEHYPDVTVDALSYIEDDLGYRLVGIVFLGGTEKISDSGSFYYREVPVYGGGGQVADLRRALEGHSPDVVVDLSDEPVLGYRERFRLISEALARGVSYLGADFRFDPPEMPFLCEKPAAGVWGTGKRVGKTAVSGYSARLLAASGWRPCVLTMGRGGPPEPELISRPEEVDDSYLRSRAEMGRHAASDHFEDALTGKAVAVGCRRCGGGMAGAPFYSNVGEGARLSCRQECDIVLCEGSGASIPPVGVDAVILVTSALQPVDYIAGFLGPYRLLQSDLVVVTMCEDFLISSDKFLDLIDGIESINPEARVIKTVFRPRPLGDVAGKRVFLASTAPDGLARIQVSHLEKEYGATVVGFSSNLADRRLLREELEAAGEAEVLVTELKAAGVDTVSFFARESEREVVYLENTPVSVDGDLGAEIERIAALAKSRWTERT